jgi:hypothetical protein
MRICRICARIKRFRSSSRLKLRIRRRVIEIKRKTVELSRTVKRKVVKRRKARMRLRWIVRLRDMRRENLDRLGRGCLMGKGPMTKS